MAEPEEISHVSVFMYPNESWAGTFFVGFKINNVDLRDLVEVVERPFAAAEGHPSIAGAYGGLLAGDILPPGGHLLGKPALGGMGAGTALLGCECGEWGCWPLMAVVTATTDSVVWSDFRQTHRVGEREWSYQGFGPLTFARAAYVAALQTPIGLTSDPRIGTTT